MSDVEVARLRQHLAESSREVAAAQARVAQMERQLHDRQEAGTRRALQQEASLSRELAEAQRQAGQGQRQAAEALARHQEADQASARHLLWIYPLSGVVVPQCSMPCTSHGVTVIVQHCSAKDAVL